MSSKDFEIKEEIYLILLKFFQGDIIFLDKEILKNLKKNKFKGDEIKELDKNNLRILEKILKLKKEKPEKYAKTRWIYPEWSEEEKIKKFFLPIEKKFESIISIICL